MSGHTETPWTASVEGWKPWEGAIQILGADGEIIAYTTSGANEKIDAPLIVKAVNNHETLVKALEEIATGCDDEHLHPFNSVWAELIKSRARDALSRVG
jgi:hypothetical protein